MKRFVDVEHGHSTTYDKIEPIKNEPVTGPRVNPALVSQDALIRVEGGYVAFVAVDRGQVEVAERRELVLGPTRRNLVVVTDGLRPGERLIVTGQKSVADGDQVNVVGTKGDKDGG